MHRDATPAEDRKPLVEQLVHRQHLTELKNILDRLHPADIAYILEALPLDDRLVVWDCVKADRDGDILMEVNDAVRETLIASMDHEELVDAVESLEADEIAHLADDLPADVVEEIQEGLTIEERAQLRASMSYPDDSVGALMDFEMITHPRGRDARGRAALPAPLRRTARPHRPGVRRRPARGAEGRPAARPAADQRTRHRGAQGDAHRPADAVAARRGGRGGAGVRALQPGLRAGRRRARATGRPPHGRRGRGRHPRGRRGGGAGTGRPARGRGPVRDGLEVRAEPLAVAGGQPLHRVHRLARHRPVRRHDREGRRARHADDGRDGDRRQLGQPDDDADDPVDRARSGHQRQLPPAGAEGDGDLRPERTGVGQHRRARSPGSSTATARRAG